MVAIATGVVLLAPTTPMAIAAGLAYGAYGVPAALLGATLGSMVATLLARSVLRRRVTTFAATRPKLGAILQAIEHEGWWVVCLLRFGSPVSGPFFSYALGLTSLSIATLSSATLVGKAVPVTVWVLVGAAGRGALSGGEFPQVQFALLCMAAVTTTVATFLVTRRARALLKIQNTAKRERR
jgi:uncharacterized membrane protein YdjX (TVP38/TMEM64 family)